ncbi:C40 family peptidase [Leptolyngbya cf. ectocarpi LEGE 11479]|uniref:C40 family peptidase n=1 Tax=Leptolyngbya cf. ectocarpi LEGE 11479 TaxID=1828722 RepID=A0A929FD09_LEPEC|nr:C40 family peptidase [Leptolyngbya ectocarpi]MBE9070627.1 C40 family peptidase [Leptolyngbya cf. ectocarpi LEGE 11479]
MQLEDLKELWRSQPDAEYRCDRTLNLYQTSTQPSLVTQAAAGRQLKITAIDPDGIRVVLSADNYPGWLRLDAIAELTLATAPYQPPTVTRRDIEQAIPGAIAFTQAAMAVSNEYLWGGTVAPNYDCSGLMQAAFASVGVPLPRDSYQQEAFTDTINKGNLLPGDLIFFGPSERTTHVALHLGAGRYIHSSGKDQGRNGIGIDSIVDLSHPVSQTYAQQYRCCGRIMEGYQPQPN